MVTKLKKSFLFMIVLLLAAASLSAQNNNLPQRNRLENIPWVSGRSSAEDLQISLITIGPGDHLTDWWGHTSLIVTDTTYNISRVYNFGYFSFDEGFVNRFAMGRLIFWAGDISLSATLSRYISAKRTIAFQELNIPVESRLTLAMELAKSVLPENSRYLYDHYKENCATRLRDYIDAAVDGQYADSMKVTGRLTFR